MNRGKGRRLIALSPSATFLLKEHKEKQITQKMLLGTTLLEDDFVFRDLKGTPLLPGTITQAWRKLARQTGLQGTRLHDVRHTHASLMLK